MSYNTHYNWSGIDKLAGIAPSNEANMRLRPRGSAHGVKPMVTNPSLALRGSMDHVTTPDYKEYRRGWHLANALLAHEPDYKDLNDDDVRSSMTSSTQPVNDAGRGRLARMLPAVIATGPPNFNKWHTPDKYAAGANIRSNGFNNFIKGNNPFDRPNKTQQAKRLLEEKLGARFHNILDPASDYELNPMGTQYRPVITQGSLKNSGVLAHETGHVINDFNIGMFEKLNRPVKGSHIEAIAARDSIPHGTYFMDVINGFGAPSKATMGMTVGSMAKQEPATTLFESKPFKAFSIYDYYQNHGQLPDELRTKKFAPKTDLELSGTLDRLNEVRRRPIMKAHQHPMIKEELNASFNGVNFFDKHMPGFLTDNDRASAYGGIATYMVPSAAYATDSEIREMADTLNNPAHDKDRIIDAVPPSVYEPNEPAWRTRMQHFDPRRAKWNPHRSVNI